MPCPFLRAKWCFHVVSEFTSSISQVGGISVLFCKIHVISESGVPSVCACVDLCQKGFSGYVCVLMKVAVLRSL
ncbi:Inactive leucine-rich repeat receptor-like protein kinase isoform D [Glycine soja]|uniref:Inactive leucine-rich repeat receptor-like protein kinase isoform D n=1 Tax=Glycine soja TaxID=3848 RepID=A0A445J5N1_GLYSO|nr:Inactive leucine-rich repeat receptor-like protein kinase isoform D [Glycine soja]